METPQDSRQPFQRPRSLGAEKDQEQQHGGNAVVSGAGEEGGDKKGLVLSVLAQGGLDQGERTEHEVAGSKRVQEEPAQSSLPLEAAGVGEEGGKKEEEMEGRHDGDGASISEDDVIEQEGVQSRSDHQQPQGEAAIPEGSRNQAAGIRLAHHRNCPTIFTHSQLRDLERLFQESHYPSFRVRRDLACSMGVDECAVHNWFRMRRYLSKHNRR
ncbi:rhox homeobox family member 2-like isoform X1 [Apodemus sylvaticus]|uniref:rhox homeobox family member 2-like isoform X1 n=1 Tax=Apodemus sylvaticus TaxID=10129 RepID=UPI002242EF91|nr:rhox homeobox family member 2-like isoform X1 [Apodemus sylvaticus]